MACYTEKTMDVRQQDFLLRELDRVYSTQSEGLSKQFGLSNDTSPSTFDELIDRIKTGKFVIPEHVKNVRMGVYSLVDYIEWRDPSVKKDQKGFDAAYEKLGELYRTTKQDIMIEPAEKGLKALRKFESATIQ